MDSQPFVAVTKQEGYLRKWTNYVLHYQRRWFVYEDGCLTYHRDPSEVGEVFRARVHLLGCKIRHTSNLGFNIVKNGAIIFALRAENRQDFNEWLRTIANGIIECDQARKSSQTLSNVSNYPNITQMMGVRECFLIQAAKVSENCNQLIIYVSEVEDGLKGVSGQGQEVVSGQGQEGVEQFETLRELTAKIVAAVEVLVSKSELLAEFAAAQKALQDSSPSQLDMDDFSQHGSEEKMVQVTIPTQNLDEENSDQVQFFDAIFDQPPETARSSSRRPVKATSFCSLSTNDRPVQHVRSVSDMAPRQDSASSGHRTTIPPRPAVKLNLWSLICNMIGKDLSKVPLPVNFNEPLSMLQRVAESLEYSFLLDKASTCDNSIMQLCYITAFTVSNYCSTAFRTNKPFNPLLGETFECDRMDDMGWRCVVEQVSHHPPVCALHAEGRGWVLWETFDVKSKFMAKYLEIRPQGLSQLVFTRSGFRYSWNKVTTSVNNIVFGTLWIDHFGTLNVRNNTTGDHAQVEFMPYSMFHSSNHRRLSGFVKAASGDRRFTLSGYWDKFFECSRIIKSVDNTERSTRREILWSAKRLPHGAEKMYNFSEFACSLNEMDSFVAPTDSRRRPDQRTMEQGDFDAANALKVRIEDAQRQKRKRVIQAAIDEGRATAATSIEQLREPLWFKVDTSVEHKGSPIYLFKGGYWEAKLKGDFSNCPNIFTH